MKRIFLIMIGLICIVNAEFIRDGVKEIVTDTSRGLMWQDNNITTPMKWQKAMQYCEDLVFPKGEENYDNWRLPNIKELYTLVDYTKKSPSVFKNIIPELYWSSSTSKTIHSKSIVIDFLSMGILYKDKKKNRFVVGTTGTIDNPYYYVYVYPRCVRDAQ